MKIEIEPGELYELVSKFSAQLELLQLSIQRIAQEQALAAEKIKGHWTAIGELNRSQNKTESKVESLTRKIDPAL